MATEFTRGRAVLLAAVVLTSLCPAAHAVEPGDRAPTDKDKIKAIVDAALKPVMEKNHIPGMAVGVAVGGKSYVFPYGIAAKGDSKPITDTTLFELGSISKTFLVTAVSLEAQAGTLDLAATVERYLPEMKGTPFGTVPLMNLATHAAGGFPLQIPDTVTNDAQLTEYFQHWKPSYAFGAIRTYANPSIGMLGVVAARAAHQDYAALMEGTVFPGLGLKNSFIHVPEARMSDYAQGYTRTDAETRVHPAPLADEAYGVKSTAPDMLRFVEENMALVTLDTKFQRAVTATHTGYFQVAGDYQADGMIQDLIWEQYPASTPLQTLRRDNSNDMLKPLPLTAITPPVAPRGDVWIDKTGSTNGFGGYLAFIPEKKIGIVILANKNYPNEERVEIAYGVLSKLP